MENDAKFRGAGGTPGGLGEFLLGVVMAAGGGYLLTNQVEVTGGSWYLWGHNAFGLTLLPLLFGIGMLFFNGRSKVGWLLLIAGSAIVLAGILMNLQIYFRGTSLFNTLMMLVLLFGGLGLILRSLRSQ
jgi:predicted membrane channel-forming protein YqfA (hemolysin III family)